MSAQSFEITLARLYTDPDFRNQFLADAKGALVDCGLTADEQADIIAIDRTGLLMASRSYLHKRKKRRHGRLRTTFFKMLFVKATRFYEAYFEKLNKG